MELVLDFFSNNYLIIKAIHIITVVSWMAGILYLPRLFVYHTVAESGSKQSETFKVMEEKLMRVIMLPAMVLTFITGGMLFFVTGVVEQPFGWFHGKLLLVLLMAGIHGAMSKWRKDFAADNNQKSERFFRVINEFPTVLMVLIIFLVVLKPF